MDVNILMPMIFLYVDLEAVCLQLLNAEEFKCMLFKTALVFLSHLSENKQLKMEHSFPVSVGEKMYVN